MQFLGLVSFLFATTFNTFTTAKTSLSCYFCNKKISSRFSKKHVLPE